MEKIEGEFNQFLVHSLGASSTQTKNREKTITFMQLIQRQ